MEKSDLNKLKSEITDGLMRQYIAETITNQEIVMHHTQLIEQIDAKKSKSEQDKLTKERYQGIIDQYQKRLDVADSRIQNFITIKKSFEEGKPLKS